MTRLAIVLGLVIKALNEENILGALKIECPSKAIYLLFHSLHLRFFSLRACYYCMRKTHTFEDILINIENVYSVIYRELSGRVLDSRPRDRRFEPLRRHCVVSLTKNINPSLVMV